MVAPVPAQISKLPPCPSAAARRRSLPHYPPRTPRTTHSLFVAPARCGGPLFSSLSKSLFLQPLYFHIPPNPPGCGVLFRLHSMFSGPLRPNLSALCFHILTNCFSRNPFIFTTIPIAPGCHSSYSEFRGATSLPRALLAKGRYPFRHASTARLLRQAFLLATIASTHRIAFSGRCPSLPWVETRMATINRQELDRLERRELQLTIMAAVFVFVLASGLAVFMYPLVFVHPDYVNRWTLRVAFFGFCALTLLFIGYLLERQSTVRKLKQQILEELERNIEIRLQASADLLHTMPDINHFWDRLTMEYRRAMTIQRNLSLLLVKAKLAAAADATSALGDAAKAMSRKLRPTDSIYHLAPD